MTELTQSTQNKEETETPVYAGFWRRLAAAIIDALLLASIGTLVATVSCAAIVLALAHELGGLTQPLTFTLVYLLPVFLLDSLFIVCVPIVLWLLAAPAPMDPVVPTVIGFNLMSYLVINWGYHALMECSEKQATIGKCMLGIKVTTTDGHRISLPMATTRHFTKIASTLVVLIGFLMADFTGKKQALHDKIARCLVVMK